MLEPECFLNLARIQEELGESDQGKYIFRYLERLNLVSGILEKEYIDKDFIVDYQKYYSRSFQEIGNKTKRLHFFSLVIKEKEFIEALNKNGVKYFEELQKNYLGFSVIKPIHVSGNKKYIGRTVLKHYRLRNDEERYYRKYIKNEIKISLFGIPLTIDSLPFQAQDGGVGACATIAIWTAIHALSINFDINTLAPVEITEQVDLSHHRNRIFPQKAGLTIDEMIRSFRGFGLDTEFYSIVRDREEFMLTLIKAYIDADIPVICCIGINDIEKNGIIQPDELYNINRYIDGHAAVITGYKANFNDNIIEIYVHDDQIGPYNKVLPIDNFLRWNNEWKTWGYDLLLFGLIVPVYHKIRIDFETMNEMKNMLNNPEESISVDLSLMSNKQLKRSILTDNEILNKSDILTTSMPRFLWILTTKSNGKIRYKKCYDCTEIHDLKEFIRIDYPE